MRQWRSPLIPPIRHGTKRIEDCCSICSLFHYSFPSAAPKSPASTMQGNISDYTCKMDVALGSLVEFMVKITPLSALLSWDIQDLGVLVPEWGI
ncbi:hypothetical protein PC128_g21989 [Phytophthora cactorum]|nr:hypothetical protein PC128_g21989 [Phytophthora cactorum]